MLGFGSKSYDNLRIYNLVMGGFHFLQAVLMVVLSNDFTLPVTTSYLTLNETTRQLVPYVEKIADLRFGPAIALFLFLSALAHFILTLPRVFEWYVEKLKKGMNFMRWYEYALSSSWMIVLIAMLSGVYDFSSLILIFAVNAAMILFGLMMELHNQTTKKTDWTSFIFGSIMGIVPWIVIAMYFIGASNNTDGGVPTFVYAIILTLFLFFNVFAVNMYLQYAKIGPWKEYLFGEKMYILLSLLAKSALAWQVFFGTLRPV